MIHGIYPKYDHSDDPFPSSLKNDSEQTVCINSATFCGRTFTFRSDASAVNLRCPSHIPRGALIGSAGTGELNIGFSHGCHNGLHGIFWASSISVIVAG